jgi:diaminobutyrate-2-oxoglutarate transaminase
MFAFEYAGIVPDAIVISKAVGGGFPLSVFLYNEAYDKWLPGAHAGTFRGNQIAMVAGTATMELILKENLVEAAQAKGQILQRHLNKLSAEFPLIGDVRGRGLMWGIEIVNPHKVADKLGSFPADGDMAREIKRRCLSNGLLVETGGRHGAVLRLLPPLIISEQEIDELVEKLYISFKQAALLR